MTHMLFRWIACPVDRVEVVLHEHLCCFITCLAGRGGSYSQRECRIVAEVVCRPYRCEDVVHC
jgi:hypothetical protein